MQEQKNREKNIILQSSYRNCCHCSVEQDLLSRKSIISVTKATEPTFKMDKVTCHCLQGDMNCTRLPVFVHRTFSHAGTGGICIPSTALREQSKTCKSNCVSFWALENWKHLSLLPAVAVERTWHGSAHTRLRDSPRVFEMCESPELAELWMIWTRLVQHVGTRFNATFNIIQQLHDWMDV